MIVAEQATAPSILNGTVKYCYAPRMNARSLISAGLDLAGLVIPSLFLS